MKQYRIFKHPAGGIEAVKQGWSWPAMFFTFLWAFFKRLWALGAAVLVLAMLAGFVLGVIVNESTADLLSNVIGIMVSLFFGLRANIWRENNLLSRGFEHVDTVSAANPEGAVAVHLRPAPVPTPSPGDPPSA